MNANELADKLETLLDGQPISDDQTNQAATMLRQQQAEIDALKEHLEKLKEAYGKQCSRANRLAQEVHDLKNENVELSNDLNMANWIIGKAQ